MIDLSGRRHFREAFWRRHHRVLATRLASCCTVVCLAAPILSAHADDITYGYDALGRLTSVTVAGATAYYDYDAAGNITAIRRQGTLSAASPMGGADSLRASTSDSSPVSPISAQASLR